MRTESCDNRIARRVFGAALAYTIALTAIWLVLIATGWDGGGWFTDCQPDRQTLLRIAGFTAVFLLLYGWIWYRIRRALLRHVVGLSEDQLTRVFESRMGRPFDLPELLASHSERRIRVVDMLGRRGRSLTLASVYMTYVYLRIASGNEPRLLTAAVADGLLDAIVMSWIYLATFRNNGLFGRIIYGAPARIMDGRLARANLLSIVMLWNAFKFVMLPISTRLGAIYPHRYHAALFGFVWISYQIADTLAEVVGCSIGRQSLPVWGLGQVNRKSVAGTIACFFGSLATCCVLIGINDLPMHWMLLALAISLSNTFFELFSPRGTDDLPWQPATLCSAGHLARSFADSARA